MSEILLNNMTEKLKGQFGDAIYSASLEREFPVFTVKKELLKEILHFLRDNPECSFRFLTTACGIHYPESKGSEFAMMYQLHNLQKNWRIRLMSFASAKETKFPSICNLFPSANWMEREAYDFFGIEFEGHPDLRKILNMEEQDYFPLRKEYPLEDATREDKNDTMFGR